MAGLLGAIWLLGYMPPNVKNYQSMLQPVVDMFAKHAPGAEPIEVYDAHQEKNDQKWVVLAWINNDIRGVPNATCGKAPPALVGSCNMCCQEGQRHLRTTVLPGAVRALPETAKSLRDDYKEEFAEVASVWPSAFEPRPAKRTKLNAIASGNRVLRGESRFKDEAYKDVDNYTTSLWYHDKIKHTLYDLAHQFANVIKHMLKYMKNKKKGDKLVFTPKERSHEVDVLGRFPELSVVTGKRKKGEQKFPMPPWVASSSSQREVDSLADILKIPAEWPAVRSIFRDLGFMKTSETLLLAGDAGAYLIRVADIPSKYCALFIELVRIIQRYNTVRRTVSVVEPKRYAVLFALRL